MPQDIRLRARLVDSGSITGSQGFSLGETVFRIGRHPNSDLVISKDTVSAHHATIEFRQNQDVIIDQNSTTKTLLNGTELEPKKPYNL